MSQPFEKERSREARVFAQKTARSIAEIQQNVNNIADVVVFLEVLGYNNKVANTHGFDDLYELARYVYNFIDVYDESKDMSRELVKSFSLPVPSMKKRLAESFGMIYPWLGSLVLLFATGVSLWMAWGLPADVTTAFLAGVFLGLVMTEGPVQIFNRLFSFYYSQLNIGEVKRAIRRNYLFVGLLLAGAVSAIFAISYIAQLPIELSLIMAASTVTVSLHRTSYMIMYALKKINHIMISYSIALAIIPAIFFATDGMFEVTYRYFLALGTAFAVLSVFAGYHHYRLSGNSKSIVVKEAPHFWSPLNINDSTIRSRFGVQIWENIPFFLFGIFYFSMLFGDRVISWIFNPATVVAANGSVMPFAFNSAYHAGADLALLIMLPVTILQYIITAPIYALAHNRSISMKVSQMKSIDNFLQKSYSHLLKISLLVSGGTAIVVNILGPWIISYIGGSEASLYVLLYASIGNVFMSVFAANSIFMVFLGRAKNLAYISIIAALTLASVGVFMAQFGYEHIVIGYLAATIIATVASLAYMVKIMPNASSRLFARYI